MLILSSTKNYIRMPKKSLIIITFAILKKTEWKFVHVIFFNASTVCSNQCYQKYFAEEKKPIVILPRCVILPPLLYIFNIASLEWSTLKNCFLSYDVVLFDERLLNTLHNIFRHITHFQTYCPTFPDTLNNISRYVKQHF